MSPPVFLPAKTSMNVVFPAPLTPTSAVRTPGRNAPVTPLRSCSRSSVTPWARIPGGVGTKYLMSSKEIVSGLKGMIMPVLSSFLRRSLNSRAVFSPSSPGYIEMSASSCLRFRYASESAYTTLRRTVKPRSAAIPVQYQCASFWIPKLCKTFFPSVRGLFCTACTVREETTFYLHGCN